MPAQLHHTQIRRRDANGDEAVVMLHRRPRLADRPLLGVVIADCQAVARAGFRALLESGGRIGVVGEATTGEIAVAVASRTQPDVVLIDAALPGLDCVAATGRILEESRARVLLVTTSAEDEHIFPALRAGARGIVLKDSEPAELIGAVEVLARGEAALAPSLARRLISELVSRPQPEVPDSGLLEELTAREREVVALVALGLTNAGIAERLVISPATARTHVSRAMVKVHAHDRAQLVVCAYEHGLATPRAGAPLSSHAS
jgi:DNA-binding NarL/FixJ family response regulator